MGIYIGGDTQTFEYDFGLKVANSIAECPMKIYKGAINPAAISTPNAPTLVSASGTLAAGTYYYKITAVDEAGETLPSPEASITLATTGGVTLSWTTVSGATGYKIYGRNTGAELLIASTTNLTYTDDGSITPSGALPTTNTTGIPAPTVTYNNLVTNGDFSNGATGWTASNATGLTANNNEASFTATASGGLIYQGLIGGSIIGHYYYLSGSIKATSSLVKLSSGPGIVSHSGSGNYEKLSAIGLANTTSHALNIIDSRTNGWDKIYAKQLFIIDLTALFGPGAEPSQAWCDANLPFVVSSGAAPRLWSEITSQSILDKLKAQNEIPVTAIASDKSTVTWNGKTLSKTTTIKVVDDFAGKISGSTVENPNIVKVAWNSIIQSPFNFISEFKQNSTGERYDYISSLGNGVSFSGTPNNGEIPQHLFSWNVIDEFERKYGTIPATDTAGKVAWLKNNLSRITCNWYGYGSCPSGNKATLGVYNNSWMGQQTNTSNSPSLLFVSVSNFVSYPVIQPDGFIHFIAYTDASDGITPSTIYTDYVSIELTLKTDSYAANYDFYTDSNTRRDAGLTDVIFVNKTDGTSFEFFTNNSVEVSVMTSSRASAYLIECDLTPIATALYGGSNAALLSALKSISVDVYAMGSGSNSGQLGNKVTIQSFKASSALDSGYTPNNITSSISKISLLKNDTNVSVWVNALNKYYIVIYSGYKSDGVISSEVNLDYVNMKVGFTRIPDAINNPPTITLTDTWSLLVRGFSPNWDNTIPTKNMHILNIAKDVNNRYELIFDGISSKKFKFDKIVNSATQYVTTTSLPVFNKYCVYNILIQQKSTGMYLQLIKNNSIFESYNNTDITPLKNLMTLYLGYLTSSLNPDAFLDSIIYMPNQVFDDTTAESILRGTKEGFEFPELLNTTLSTTQTVKVLPNNQYQLKTALSTTITEMYNNIVLKTTTVTADTAFITQPRTNNIKFDITGSFTGMSLKLKM